MNLDELKEALYVEIQDSSVSEGVIRDQINEALGFIASNSWIPDLLTEGSVTATTGSRSQDLPVDYDHDVFEVRSDTSERMITILNNRRWLYRSYGLHQQHRKMFQYGGYHNDPFTVTGEIKHCAVEGKLWFLPIPLSDEILRLQYYRKPDPLLSSSDTPDWLPADLHLRLVIDQLMAGTFCLLSEAVDDRDVAVRGELYRQRFNEGLIILGKRFPKPSLMRGETPRSVHWF